MNKTININLGGFFFHIDETAFQKLKRYLEAISKSLNDDPQGKSEIIADIEARISELLSEKITDERQVVNENDIEEIIKIMGQPEDYAEAEEGYLESDYSYKKNTEKKLFRDSDDKFLGGVCSGIGHYIGIDAIWIRLAFITLAFSGFSILAYIILWILLPEAQTTVEKLQMEGEPVNIDNIEKKIREEFVNFSEKLKDGATELGDKISSADYEKLRKKSKSGFQVFLDTLGKIILAVLKFIGKFIGVLLMFVAGAVLISLIIGGFSIGSLEYLNVANDFVHYPPFFYDSIFPTWLLTLLFFIAIAVPFLILFVLGLRIISSSVKRFSKTTNLTLLGIWIIAILGLSFSGIEFATTKAHAGFFTEKKEINNLQKDSIHIKFVTDENLFDHNIRRRFNKREVLVNDSLKKYANLIYFNIKHTNSDNFFIKINKTSEGRSIRDAHKNAKQINYHYTIDNNNLSFNDYFLSPIKNKYKDEVVNITLYVPSNKILSFDENVVHFLGNIEKKDDDFDTYKMGEHTFKITKKGLICIDCTTKTIEKEDQSN